MGFIEIDGLADGGVFRTATRLLAENVDVAKWLLGETAGKVRSDMLQKTLVPFDFLKLEQGPEVGVRETVVFRKSLVVASHLLGDVGFAFSVKVNGDSYREDRMVVHYDIETGDMMAIITNQDSEGLTIRCSVVLQSLYHSKGFVFIAKAPPGSNRFHGVQYVVMDTDCDFCTLRQEPCHCDVLKQRFLGNAGAVVPFDMNPFSMLNSVTEKMSGNGWMHLDTGVSLRTNLSTEKGQVFPRVQQIFSLATTSWKTNRLLTGMERQKGLLLLEGNSPTIEQKQVVRKKKSKKGHPCPLCGSSFRTKYHFTRHWSTVHERQKNYACDICGKRFTQSSHLDVHVANIHHEMPKILCSYCDHEFRWRANYLKHMRKRHPGALNP
ncbi:hypothetical protein NDN08_007673 [Rhodosorus marinus]|uniref:C2H2-type domain-containing protein n=1 Tax=Rhodosorus marinus TaxID=101924 RepID=A0AAV8V1T5_9RHOD|nr:hypothetical protein NDN08_007673 [Rhodosorus marinus]